MLLFSQLPCAQGLVRQTSCVITISVCPAYATAIQTSDTTALRPPQHGDVTFPTPPHRDPDAAGPSSARTQPRHTADLPTVSAGH